MTDSERDSSDSKESPPDETERTIVVDPSQDPNFLLNEFGETVSLVLSAGSQTDAEPARKKTAADRQMPEKIDRYEIQDILGQGGYGAVYLGYDTQLKRRVAIKVPLLSGSTKDAELDIEKEFLQEAQQLARLNHPGIVTVYDVGIADGHCYIVSDYLDGKDLNRWLKDHQPHWTESVQIVADVADALAHAHSQSTVHRDIKPANIILTERPEGLRPVVVDFGLAVSDLVGTSSLRGVISGTPNFMSPEQAQGRATSIDGRTDIFSLGVVLYRMLCGKLPFQSSRVSELLRKVIEDAPQLPRTQVHDIPRDVERICLKAMAKHIDDRYTSSADFAAELREVLKQEGTTAAPTKEKVKPTGPVRRQVTVLWCGCDLFESTEFTEEVDPEDQHETMVEYQRLCESVVQRLDGTIIQSGEEMIVCFGYPTAFEDSARRAVNTGLTLLEELSPLRQRLQKEYNITFETSIAIHTGSAVLQATGTGEGETLSMTGEARTVVTRLESIAEPNAVVVTESTEKLTHGFFVCESLGKHRIKGAPDRLEIHHVLHESKARSRIDISEAQGLTPLVGRDTELAMLDDLWEQAEEGMGQIVCLIGEAGLGKSRLIREIEAHVVEQSGDDHHHVVEWRSSPFFKNTSLHPAIDFFERLLDIDRQDAPEAKLDKLVAHLAACELDHPATVPLFAALLSIPVGQRYPPLKLSPIRQKEKTLEALLNWVQCYAAKQPVLFIIEDLHWIDPTSLELLSALVDQGLKDRVLTILTFRPEFETPWGNRAHQTHVALNRLTKPQIELMMQQRLKIKAIPSVVVDQVIDRTEGVPLFIEEYSDMIHESGALKEVDGKIELAEGFDLHEIPSTLQDLLVSRLDRMESDREVVQLGATLGREFPYELISAVSSLDQSSLQVELSKLVTAELVFQSGNPPEAIYTFKHALIQDAAYDSLLRRKRQEFHKGIAEALEQKFPESAETEPEVLAHHFTEAGESQKGIEYWFKAGQHAQQRSANTEAISHLTRGLKVLEPLEESPARDQLELGLQLTLAPVLMAARGWSAPEVGTAIERAQQLVSEIGAVEDQFFVMWGLWGWRIIRADMDLCAEIADDIMQLVEKSSDGQELLSEAYWVVGCTAYYKGDFKTGLDLLEKGLALIDDEKERAHSLKTGQRCSLMCRSHTALALWQMGYPDQALQRADETVRFGKDLDHPFSFAMGLFFGRQVLEFCGLRDQARARVEEEYTACHEGGFVFFEVHAIFGRGVFLLSEGKLDEAREQFDLGLEMLKATGGNLSMDHPYRNIAEEYLLAGRLDDAQEWLNRGFDLVNNHNERGMESEFLRLQGALALAAGDEKLAEQNYQRAAEVAQQQQARSWELRTMISFAELRQRQGKPSEARQMLESTYSFFTEGFDTSDLVKAKSLLDELEAEV